MDDKPHEEPWPILVLVELTQDKVDLVSDKNKAPSIGGPRASIAGAVNSQTFRTGWKPRAD